MQILHILAAYVAALIRVQKLKSAPLPMFFVVVPFCSLYLAKEDFVTWIFVPVKVSISAIFYLFLPNVSLEICSIKRPTSFKENES